MDAPAIITLAVVGVLFVVAVVILVARSGASRKRKLCGGCRRVMMPEWQRCLFCGWMPPPPVPRLDFLSGPLGGQSIPLHEEVTTIGSVAGNSIVLPDPAVSRKHIGIRRAENRFEFADLGSTNGVYVNGHRTPKKMLVSGDILRVGNTEMVFRVG